MTEPTLSAASYPPLQKTQGRATHSSGMGSKNSEALATRPSTLSGGIRRTVRKISDRNVNAIALDGLKIETSVPFIRQLQMGWTQPVHSHIHATRLVRPFVERQNHGRRLRACRPVKVDKCPGVSRSDPARLDSAGACDHLPIRRSALCRPARSRTVTTRHQDTYSED
jgi:hypothetical protein